MTKFILLLNKLVKILALNAATKQGKRISKCESKKLAEYRNCRNGIAFANSDCEETIKNCRKIRDTAIQARKKLRDDNLAKIATKEEKSVTAYNALLDIAE